MNPSFHLNNCISWNIKLAMDKITPQQRWQNYKQQLPSLTRRQKWLASGGIATVLLIFVIFLLPYLLPLAGPRPQDPQKLADKDGAFIEIDGTHLYYKHLAGDDATILLIHGQAGSTQTWRETMPVLNEAGYNVYALDFPGLGLSAKGLDQDYSYPRQAELLQLFMTEMNLDEVYLVAHAFGSNPAMMLAQNEPDKVRGLALVAPTLFTDTVPKIPSFLFDLAFARRWMQVTLHFVVHEAVGEQLRSATKKDEVVTDDLIADYARGLSTPDWDLAVWGMLRDSHQNMISKPLEALNMPIVLLWGNEDGWATPDNALWMLETFSNSCLVSFEKIGHLPMHEVPDEFSQELILFLQSGCINGDIDLN